MRLITNEELSYVSGGDGIAEDGQRDANAARGGVGINDDMQMNPGVVIAAVIAGGAAIISAVIAYFKDPAPAAPVASKVTVTTYECTNSKVDGEQICTVTGQVVTETQYVKP
ncbi:hypothetical protein [Undibacterium sp. TS12]|uniref:hypothetical protein n=1 Tax=Undibacterium sp. TS12 TaxID=2908202 RepID=UPI001F4CD6F2|nr:hypothetical protein [Undibacterium sp. TS12]MCH8622334.1 hypothetical protein [Undibacterium sp. TS12]